MGKTYAYSVLQDNGELVLFRSEDRLRADGTRAIVRDVDGNRYSGTVFGDFEHGVGSPTMTSRGDFAHLNIQSVRIADGQRITPESCKGWFWMCENMTECDLTGLDLGLCSDVSRMFCNSGIERLTLPHSTLSTSRKGHPVVDAHDMLRGCSSLVSADISAIDFSRCHDMSGMLRGCRNLKEIKGLSNTSPLPSTDTTDITKDCGKLNPDCLPSFMQWVADPVIDDPALKNGLLSYNFPQFR